MQQKLRWDVASLLPPPPPPPLLHWTRKPRIASLFSLPTGSEYVKPILIHTSIRAESARERPQAPRKKESRSFAATARDRSRLLATPTHTHTHPAVPDCFFDEHGSWMDCFFFDEMSVSLSFSPFLSLSLFFNEGSQLRAGGRRKKKRRRRVSQTVGVGRRI